MKIRILLGLLLVMLFTAGSADAQRYHRGYRGGGYRHGYYARGPRAVVVVNPGYHPRRYYGRGYSRGYRRGYYAGPRYHRYYGRPRYYGHRRYYHGRRW